MREKLFKLYDESEIGQSELCRKCRKETNVVTKAQSPYIITKKAQRESIFFVGKVARGDSFGKEINEFFEDVSDFGHEFITHSSWPYYSYTRSIIEKIYGNIVDGLENISFANIIKCNDNSDKDTTDYKAKEYCINQCRYIWKEIEIVKPRKVVLYTGWNYDNFLASYRYPDTVSIVEHSDRYQSVKVGNKMMPWWDRSFLDSNGEVLVDFLRVGHPERKNKEDYVNLIVQWLKK